MKREPLLLDSLVVLIFSLVGLVLGIRPLLDPDLGWHLAGGLWILENHTVPMLDPFGVLSSSWVAYSWLAEVLFAMTYKSWGFGGLQFLQVVLILSSVWSVLALYRVVVKPFLPSNELRYRLSWVLASFLTIFFIAPIWHLRPQLLSVILFVIALTLAERKRLSLGSVIVLGVLWANIHIYWMFLPTIVALYMVVKPAVAGDHKAILPGLILTAVAILCGLFTPYGSEAFHVIREYASSHEVANGVITEFQHLRPTHGLIFYLYWAVIALLLGTARSLKHEKEIPPLTLSFVLGFLAYEQVKFLALFGVVVGIVLARRSFPAFLTFIRRSKTNPTDGALAMRIEHHYLIAVLILLFSSVCGLFFRFPEPLPPKVKELMVLVGEAIHDPAKVLPEQTKPIPVLNHFNQGGWLALFFWLNRPAESTTTVFKTAVDGRTLVMGPRRLAEFERLRRGDPTWCEILKRWGMTVAILPRNAPLTKALLQGQWPDAAEKAARCEPEWKIIRETPNWAVLQAGNPSEKKPPQRRRRK